MTNNETQRNQTHYSYKVYERNDVAEGFESLRFGGPIGQFFKTYQEALLNTYLPDVTGMSILDLGAGTGRTSIPLSLRGGHVIAADASFPMLRVAMKNAQEASAPISGIRADAHCLPFEDRCFDVVVCFRMIMHVVNWTSTLAEICRIANQAIVLDFPPRSGFAGLAPLLHPMLRRIKRDHQSYHVFRDVDVIQALEKNGFSVTSIDRHVVLPFGFHRAIGSLPFTRHSEAFLRSLGLTRRFGAPVTIFANRRKT